MTTFHGKYLRHLNHLHVLPQVSSSRECAMVCSLLPEPPAALPFYFHWDRDLALDASHIHITFYMSSSCSIFLIRHPGPLSREIRVGYIANQICLILNEFVFFVLIRVYPIMPYPALYCDGPLCQLGLPQQAITTILAAFVILPNPPFEFLLLCMHQKIVANTTSRLRFSQRIQNRMMYTLVILLILNVVGFGTFGTPYSQMISNHSDRNYLGSLLEEVNCFFSVIFECYFLASTLVIVFPVVVVLSIHATHIIQQAKSYTTDQTIRLQNRVMVVILIQTFFILNPMPLSLFFLFKNGTHREMMWKKLKCLFDFRIRKSIRSLLSSPFDFNDAIRITIRSMPFYKRHFRHLNPSVHGHYRGGKLRL
ncbi:hypothetical protein PRIPAC_81299 [Pristionchus pacificus]|uniref:Uncharacterized protein n=1 Tax=Pristionchus pacificus TaxID=54126 RepID=A0A2A6C2C1_PRIPA|nr:hypothetical protein PRIPAC_81299 [Pristionchus pacificus]|eukprot:PDM72259.1 hypothetical protein PRIPAC_38693 [Pristionchus pacificus]